MCQGVRLSYNVHQKIRRGRGEGERGGGGGRVGRGGGRGGGRN